MYQAEEECTSLNTPCVGAVSMSKVIQKAIVKRRWHWNIQNGLLLLESWIISSVLSLCASEPQKVEVKQDEGEELWWEGIPYTLQNPFTINQSVNVCFFFFPLSRMGVSQNIQVLFFFCFELKYESVVLYLVGTFWKILWFHELYMGIYKMMCVR